MPGSKFGVDSLPSISKSGLFLRPLASESVLDGSEIGVLLGRGVCGIDRFFVADRNSLQGPRSVWIWVDLSVKATVRIVESEVQLNCLQTEVGKYALHFGAKLNTAVNNRFEIESYWQLTRRSTCSDITNDQLGISGETGHGGANLYIY